MTKITKRLLIFAIVIVGIFCLFNGVYFFRKYIYFDKFHNKMDIQSSDFNEKILDNGDHISFTEPSYLSIDGGHYNLWTANKKGSTVTLFIVAYPRIFNYEYNIQVGTKNPLTNKTESYFGYYMDKDHNITSSITQEQQKLIDENKEFIDEKINTLSKFFELD